jgi:hypothetical protein
VTDPVSSHNLDGYGSAELPWSRARDVMAADTPLALRTAVGVAGAEPYGATRWTF